MLQANSYRSARRVYLRVAHGRVCGNIGKTGVLLSRGGVYSVGKWAARCGAHMRGARGCAGLRSESDRAHLFENVVLWCQR